MRLEGNAQWKPLTLVYIGLVSVFGLSGGDISPSQTEALLSGSSLPIAPLSFHSLSSAVFSSSFFWFPCYCLHRFPSTLFCWILLMSLVSFPSACPPVRQLSHETKRAHRGEEEDVKDQQLWWKDRASFSKQTQTDVCVTGLMISTQFWWSRIAAPVAVHHCHWMLICGRWISGSEKTRRRRWNCSAGWDYYANIQIPRRFHCTHPTLLLLVLYLLIFWNCNFTNVTLMRVGETAVVRSVATFQIVPCRKQERKCIKTGQIMAENGSD